MSAQVDHLKQVADAAIANSADLKAKLVAAIAANAAQTAQLATVQAELVTAQANAADPADAAAIAAIIQNLTDSTAINNPAN